MASRLAELQGSGAPPAPGTTVTINTPANMGGATAGSDQILEQFYKLVAECQTHIREIQTKTAEVQQKHAEQLRSPDVEKSKVVFAEIETIMNSINDNSRKCKDKLQLMNDGTNKLKATPQDEAANSSVIKIQQNQHAHLVRTFTQAMKDYQDVQDENKRSYEEQTARQIKIKCTAADGSTIDEAEAMRLAREVLQSGQEDAIFSQSKETLAQIIETRNDIYKIEASMRELNQLFNDLAALVTDQGEVMDQVLHNVQQATQYVEKGNQNLQDAKKYAKSSRKKMCWIIMLLFVILLFILAPVLGATISV